jgi:hypothetical protein
MGADNCPRCAHGAERSKTAFGQTDRPRAPRRALALPQTRRNREGDERGAALRRNATDAILVRLERYARTQ